MNDNINLVQLREVYKLRSLGLVYSVEINFWSTVKVEVEKKGEWHR